MNPKGPSSSGRRLGPLESRKKKKKNKKKTGSRIRSAAARTCDVCAQGN